MGGREGEIIQVVLRVEGIGIVEVVKVVVRLNVRERRHSRQHFDPRYFSGLLGEGNRSTDQSGRDQKTTATNKSIAAGDSATNILSEAFPTPHHVPGLAHLAKPPQLRPGTVIKIVARGCRAKGKTKERRGKTRGTDGMLGGSAEVGVYRRGMIGRDAKQKRLRGSQIGRDGYLKLEGEDETEK